MIWNHRHWPLQWRGGRLHELHKKHHVAECNNYRGLLISDHMSKGGAEVVHGFVELAYTSFVPKQRCGATEGRGTDLATHVLRLLQDHARLHKMSLALFFLT